MEEHFLKYSHKAKQSRLSDNKLGVRFFLSVPPLLHQSLALNSFAWVFNDNLRKYINKKLSQH